METIAYTVAGVTTEISFTALGVGVHPSMQPGTHGVSKFIVPLPGTAPETAAVIPFEARCTIYTGRAYVAGSWSGGSILFQGFRTDNNGSASSSGVSTTLVIEDEWYFLKNVTLQAVWKIVTGGTEAAPTYGTASWPDAVLFQATPGVTYSPIPEESHITTGQAIVEILDYAISIGANLQVGTIDPSLYVPFYPIRCERCDQAIKYALRVHPDCATEIDYTTTPPTFNVRKRANLTALTFPYKGASTSGGVTRTHLTSTIKPRPDLQPSRVGIYLKETSSLAGQTVINVGSDVYPAVASGLRAFDVSIDMTGPTTSQVTGQITAYAFNPADLAFWTTHVPALNSATHLEVTPSSLALINTAIGDGSLQCITVLDATGAAVPLTDWPNYLGGQGTVHPWMNVQTKEVFVTGYLTYQQRKNIGTAGSPVWVNIGKPNSHPHTVKVKLTTAPAGTTAYRLNQLLNTGETYPGGLAQGVYTALSLLQYQFKHTILEQPFTTVVKPGKHALNVSGGATAWLTMNAMVQSSTIKFTFDPVAGITSAETTIDCGPVAHLEPGQLIQLFNIFQNRDLSRINPNERSSGLPNGGANAAMPSDTAKEDTTPAAPDSGVQMFTAPDSVTTTNFNGIQFDPATNRMIHTTYQPSSATPVGTGYLAPRYYGNGAPAAGTLPANTQFYLYHRYVDTSQTPRVEYECTTSGTNSTSAWTQIGGSGGGSSYAGLQQFVIVSDGGDFWLAISYNGGVYGPCPVPIQKEEKMRAGANAISSETIRGVTYTYSYTAASTVNVTINSVTYTGQVPYYQRSVSGSDGSSENDYTIPDPVAGNFIMCLPTPEQLNTFYFLFLTATMVSAGTGFTAGDVLTIPGGTYTTQAKITVNSVNPGASNAIVSFTLTTRGVYSVLPGSLTAVAVTGGSGSGATFTLTANTLLQDMTSRHWAK